MVCYWTFSPGKTGGKTQPGEHCNEENLNTDSCRFRQRLQRLCTDTCPMYMFYDNYYLKKKQTQDLNGTFY